jgi:hypothetical protein
MIRDFVKVLKQHLTENSEKWYCVRNHYDEENFWPYQIGYDGLIELWIASGRMFLELNVPLICFNIFEKFYLWPAAKKIAKKLQKKEMSIIKSKLQKNINNLKNILK